jgi:hypothetical protein
MEGRNCFTVSDKLKEGCDGLPFSHILLYLSSRLIASMSVWDEVTQNKCTTIYRLTGLDVVDSLGGGTLSSDDETEFTDNSAIPVCPYRSIESDITGPSFSTTTTATQ